MIVFRWTWNVKRECTGELVKALKSWPEYGLPRPPHGGRVYSHTPMGPWDVVTWEQDFESLAEYDAWQKEWFGAPRFGEWFDVWHKNLVDRGGGGEVWNVESFE